MNCFVNGCINEAAEGEVKCVEHLGIRCSVCGEPAVVECESVIPIYCGVYLCGSKLCHLRHWYIIHGTDMDRIQKIEGYLNLPPERVLIAKVISKNERMNNKYKSGFILKIKGNKYYWTTMFVSDNRLDVQLNTTKLLTGNNQGRLLIDTEEELPNHYINRNYLDLVISMNRETTRNIL